jgi:hypothetical protein
MNAASPGLHVVRGPLSAAGVTLAIAACGVVLTLVSARLPLAAVVVIYPLTFAAIAWRWPKAALLFVFATAPFQKDLSLGGPVRFSAAELHLFLTLPIFLTRAILFRRPVPVGLVFWFVALHIGLCAATTWVHWRPTSLVSLIQMGLYLVVAVSVFSAFADHEEDLLLPLNGLVVVASGLAVAQIVAPSFVASPEWLGLQKNGIGASLASALVIALELYFATDRPRRRRQLLFAMALLGGALILTLSRGAWMAAAIGVGVIAALRRQYVLLLRMALLMIPVVAVCWIALPEEAREYATGFDSSRYNILARYESIEFAKSQFNQGPLTGVGVGLRKEYDATNVVLLTLAESGVPGLLTFGLIHLAVLVLCWRTTRRYARWHPLYSMPAIAGALVLGRLGHGMVDHYWSRGAIMIAWASVGMATAAYCFARSNPSGMGMRNAQ